MFRTAAALATLLALPSTAGATEIGSSRAFGLGIVLGSPSGISGKYYIGGRTNAIDFSVGSWYSGRYGSYYGGYRVAVAYHWHFEELASGGGVAIPIRIGVGGFVSDGGFYDDWFGETALGVHVPFGLDFDLESAPVQFFGEVGAEIPVYPFFGLGFALGIGVRYYF